MNSPKPFRLSILGMAISTCLAQQSAFAQNQPLTHHLQYYTKSARNTLSPYNSAPNQPVTQPVPTTLHKINT